MSRMELELKKLDIDEKKFIKKLEELGAKFIEKNNQYLYTYDLPTIYGRFIDILFQLNNPESKIKYETALSKLKLLFFEVDNLLNNEDKLLLKKLFDIDNLNEILERNDLLKILNKKEFNDFLSKFHNNSKKWIRLRQTDKKTTLTVKHILADNETNIQQMLETEMEVPSIKEANEFLEALGFSYKSYQEKRRVTYELDGYEIDIDTWPGIPTYFEIEGNSKDELKKIFEKLGYDIEESISCTADEVYKIYGKSMFNKRELKFEKD